MVRLIRERSVVKNKGIPLGKGFGLNKKGALVKTTRHLDASKRIAQSKSRKVRVKRGK
jgi:hypothetical protein